MKIVIADQLPISAGNLLRAEGWTVDEKVDRTKDELNHDLADADALIVRSRTTVDADLIKAAEKLRVVGRAGTGVDNIDVEAATARGVLVLNAPGANSVSVAEHACALILASARGIALADQQMKTGRWEKQRLQGTELRGKTLGVVGFGRVGQEVARRAKAFEMEIVAHDPFISTHVAKGLGIELVTLDALCQRSDFITLHLPSTPSSQGFLNQEFLAHCKVGVRIINTSRGDLIDEAALAEAVASGHVAGAGLDVFQVEPPTDMSLTGLPQVVATPHIAGSTREAQELVGLETANFVREYLRSGIVRNAINLTSVAPEEFRRLQPYLTLAERLGRLLTALSIDPFERISLRYYGELAQSTSEMLVNATLVGLFRPMLSSTVTLVNARAIARQRGVEVVESQSSRARNFTSLISLKLHTESSDHWVEGAVFEPHNPRLVMLDGVEIEVPLTGTLIVIRNNDTPGVIGEVGSILGRHGINITTFALGRGLKGAIGVVSVETRKDNDHAPMVTEEVLKEVRSVPAVRRVALVKL
jgi:D-3-phosphoglycerate dehydrogenase